MVLDSMRSEGPNGFIIMLMFYLLNMKIHLHTVKRVYNSKIIMLQPPIRIYLFFSRKIITKIKKTNILLN